MYIFDFDFRNSLFHHHKHHYGLGNTSINIPKGKFSFRNIHKNIGSVRWYTTRSSRFYATSSAAKNRQSLFQENFRIVTDILNHNYNCGSKEIQEKIEIALHHQEMDFGASNSQKIILKFGEKSYKYLVNVLQDLNKIISNPDFVKNSMQTNSRDYMSCVGDIIKVLSVESVCKLLLELFMEKLTKETTRVQDIETPGIPTLIAFEEFGNKIVNRYIFLKYVKNGKKGTLSQYKESNKDEFAIFMRDSAKTITGGTFVWALVTTKLFYQDLDANVLDRKKEF